MSALDKFTGNIVTVCVLFLWADVIEYLRKKCSVLFLLYSCAGLQRKTANGFPII